MFQVPSTPDSRRGGDDDHPSTTPAGPPPTGLTHQSFTPAGNPPSSVFGSSFGLNPKPLSFSNFAKPNDNATSKASARAPSRTFEVPSSSPPRAASPSGTFASKPASQPAVPAIDWNNLGFSAFGTNGTTGNGTLNVVDDDVLDFQDSPRGAKRSRNGEVMAPAFGASRILGRNTERESTMVGVADSLAATLASPAAVEEQDSTIARSESYMTRLDAAAKTAPEEALEQAAQAAAHSLSDLWFPDSRYESVPASIGPIDSTGAARANYIASLLFAIYQNVSVRTQEATERRFGGASVTSTRPVPFPQALLGWLNMHHNPFPDDLAEVQSAKPSATAHDRFWDTIFQTLLRGNISTVIKLLSGANWSHAESALEDGYDSRGYTGDQLAAVQYVVHQCVELLQTCPILDNFSNWEVTGTEWQLFRTRARRALEELEEYAEADSENKNDNVNLFAASAAAKGSFAAGTRRAESRVPWTLYEQLKAVYGQLLGYREEILLSAQDWLEATIYLAVWWDGEDEGYGRRTGNGRQRTRTVDVDAGYAYRKRLLDAFASVTDEPEDSMLRVNTIDPVQVALGCIFEGEIEGVLKLLQKWSLLVAASVVDVASVGGWMPEGRPRTGDMMDAFNQEDLMVLSHGQFNQKKTLDRDTVLIAYAELLAKKSTINDGQTSQTGWEVAVRVLSRLDSAMTAQQKITDLFAKMTFTSASQVDAALAVCNELGLADQVRAISSRYADTLASTSHAFGPALLYYARAHATSQLQTTVDLLLSTSLVRSAAYPAFAELDPQLEELLRDQATVLARLNRSDHEAAKLLGERLSGYATLRRFYDLRDEDVEDDDAEDVVMDGKAPSRPKKSGLRPAARRKEMARAIVALVDSAAESIRGGLYDEEVKGVVQIDALLALLGEALPLLTQSTPSFTKCQLLTLLRATEDLEQVSSRIREQAEALFQACMADFHSASTGAEPVDLARSLQLGARSTSALSNASSGGFAMVNSKGSVESEKRLGAEQQQQRGSPDEGKGWDWRRGVALTIGKVAGGGDVVRLLRVGVAREVGRGWAAGR